jgi:hypothetical protein
MPLYMVPPLSHLQQQHGYDQQQQQQQAHRANRWGRQLSVNGNGAGAGRAQNAGGGGNVNGNGNGVRALQRAVWSYGLGVSGGVGMDFPSTGGGGYSPLVHQCVAEGLQLSGAVGSGMALGMGMRRGSSGRRARRAGRGARQRGTMFRALL